MFEVKIVADMMCNGELLHKDMPQGGEYEGWLDACASFASYDAARDVGNVDPRSLKDLVNWRLQVRRAEPVRLGDAHGIVYDAREWDRLIDVCEVLNDEDAVPVDPNKEQREDLARRLNKALYEWSSEHALEINAWRPVGDVILELPVTVRLSECGESHRVYISDEQQKTLSDLT
jgi:hypothetical protein